MAAQPSRNASAHRRRRLSRHSASHRAVSISVSVAAPAALAASVAIAVLLLLLPVVSAHRRLTVHPSCGSDYGSSRTALPVSDPTISWAFRHHLDCVNRAVWVRIIPPEPDFTLYVGVGVPTLDRYEGLRADVAVIGPGLPIPSAEERRLGGHSMLPPEVADDPVWERGTDREEEEEEVGALIFRSPDDQSTCDHLGAVMKRSSTVKDGRCDFFEPFGKTHSWRIVDADGINLPRGGVEYYVTVYLQEHTSGKVSIALGTWIENFWADIPIDDPDCETDLTDFYEKDGDRSDEFPVVPCSGPPPPPSGPTSDPDVTKEPTKRTCDLGQVCDDDVDGGGCTVAGISYRAPTSGACGGRRCPAAVELWEGVNARMHAGMSIEYTGDVEIDFVRAMIPHHQGAVDMCRVLIDDLTCAEVSDLDALDGLVQFCGHVWLTQDFEIGGMRAWLRDRGFEEEAPCTVAEEEEKGMMMMMHGSGDGNERRRQSDHGDGDGHGGGHGSGHGGGHGGHGGGGCGNVAAPSSERLIRANDMMHAAMVTEYGCDHVVDFARMMIPHHAGGVDMCMALTEFPPAAGLDPYLAELCANVTVVQLAEVAWLHRWLGGRGHAVSKPCHPGEGEACEDGSDPIPVPTEPPCEDLLPASGFCHILREERYCRCDRALKISPCEDGPSYVEGMGEFDAGDECPRSCGRCPDERPPLYYEPCPQDDGKEQQHQGGLHGGNGGGHGMGDAADSGSQPETHGDGSGCGASGGVQKHAQWPLVVRGCQASLTQAERSRRATVRGWY